MHPAQEIAQKIQKTAENQLLNSPYFVLDVTVSSTKISRIRLVVDGDKGVTIDECAEISRELNHRIEGLKVLEDYNLEVTTPGVDQPLKNIRQYPKHVGRQVKVELKNGAVLQGKLIAVANDSIHLEEDQKKIKGKVQPLQQHEIRFDEIKKTFVLVSFK